MTHLRFPDFKIALTLSVGALLVSAHAAAAGNGEHLLDCDELVVQYDEPTVVPLAGHITIKPLKQRPERVLNEYDPQYVSDSPQATAAFNRVVTADTTRPGPRSNVVEVFSTKGDPVAWQIEAVDLMDDMRLRWLNEDLLFVQAWWGRIVSTDLIFQLSSGRFLYAKEANYGLLVQPCEERGGPVNARRSRRSRGELPGDG